MGTFGYILLGIVVVGFFVAWRKGHLQRLADYVGETKVELRKCTWPTREELKGSTLVVVVSVAILGTFTMLADLAISRLILLINSF